MKFKEWLLKEDPDKVPLQSYNRGPNTLMLTSGRTFSIFDQYALFSPVVGGRVIHDSIAWKVESAWMDMEEASEGKKSPGEIDKIMTSHELVGLSSVGNITQRGLDLLRETVKIIRGTSSKRSYRDSSVSNLPGVILGRLWEKEKIVSFWNKALDVFKESRNVINLVRHFGDPGGFSYEVSNELLRYEDFLNRRGGGKPDFDASILHTLPPGELKSQLQGMAGMRKANSRVDLKTRYLAQTSEQIRHG